MQDLIILGSTVGDGTHSAEMVELVERVNRVTPTWRLLGYITAAGAKQQHNGYSVLGGPEAIEKFPRAHFVAMNGRPPAELVPPGRLATLVDPGAFVSRTASVGRGVVIYPNVFVGLNARIHDHVFVLAGAVINHDVTLEHHVIVASGVMLAGSVHVGARSYLGQACTIREKICIGEDALIGTGAVVVKDVPARSVMAGNPARVLRQR